ncbi:hypothetical protein [Variovorax ginsengisoli]|uniref:Uncharacterized protein n=1 Tax=Variovorax ginsengisoli TaxID=363844 RepID=A0ABT9SCS9_9BURK|nr:hypothetical protein [Variovorax ginsengisoli]MDP9902144.1 hypothetical protein [Variovorax ginsengisoli]
MKDPADKTSFLLTIHDPSHADVSGVVRDLADLEIMALEISIDLIPKAAKSFAAREALLQSTFKAVAGRFRPEDAPDWGYGMRGALTAAGQIPAPFHRRFPGPDEELIYGHRGDFVQSKAYLKRADQGKALPLEQHRVRMELSLRRLALMSTAPALRTLTDLQAFPYRKAFAKHFRLIGEPALRAQKGRDAAQTQKLERQMVRAWKTAGVGKFAPDVENLPPDTSRRAARQALARASEQLPKESFVLKRDALANRKVASALRTLERRMA